MSEQLKMKIKFSQNSNRSLKAKKNIIVSGLFKGADMLIYLLLVPLTLGYLNAYEYGIWLTLNTILGWINSFDIGLGSGLRNKLAEAIAQNDKELARKYVSTTFFMLIALMVILCAIGVLLINITDWYSLLNVTEGVDNLREIIFYSFFFFCLNFVLKFVGNVYQALQLPAAMYIINFAGHLLSLIIIFILTKVTPGSLFLVALVYSSAPPLIYVIVYPITFKIFFKYLSPSIKYIEKNCIRGLFNLSLMFFFLQISGLILLSFSNVLISNMFGPASVTPYNIAQRYFSIIPMLTNIILAPMWSATTDAFTKGDYKWVQRAHLFLVKVIFIDIIIFCLMFVFSPQVYHIWIGNEVEIPYMLSLLSAIYNIILIWSLSYSYMLNGMGKLKIQTINTIIVSLCFCPLCYILGLKLGVQGVLLGMCVVNLSGAILNTIQFHLIITGKAKGVWLK